VRLGYSQRKQLHRFEGRRPASLSGLDEVLIPDARSGLTPADMVERKVVHLLEGSHARLGDAESRVARRSGNQRRLILRPTKPHIQEEHVMRVIERGDKVRVHYVKVFQDGSTVSSHGKAPTELTVGTDHPRLPGLGLALVGLAAGGIRTFIVPARDAYGPINPKRIRFMARWRFAEHEDLSVGQWVRVWDRQCRRRLVRIVEIGEEAVVVDANHRWAGQSLELEVRVISIRGPEVASSANDDSGDTSSTVSSSPEKISGR
jgi:FKBP-type peptidyl-prolyl cis-trans isomerase 2